MLIDTSDNASYNQVYWLFRTPYLSIKASNAVQELRKKLFRWLKFSRHLKHNTGFWVCIDNFFLTLLEIIVQEMRLGILREAFVVLDIVVVFVKRY